MTDMTVSGSHASDQGNLIAELAKLREENAKLKAKAAARSTISFKVTEKGGVSAYGLGRFPVTLYLSQWDRLIKSMPDLENFLVENASKLATKD